jgi:hypothetical protein
LNKKKRKREGRGGKGKGEKGGEEGAVCLSVP